MFLRPLLGYSKTRSPRKYGCQKKLNHSNTISETEDLSKTYKVWRKTEN